MGAVPRRTAGLVAVLVMGLLLVAAPTPSTAVELLRNATVAVEPTAPLVALLTLLAWALAGWLATTAVLTVLAQVPGRAGRAAAVTVRRVAPGALRRLVSAALGVTVAATALGASPANAAGPVRAAATPTGAPAASPLDGSGDAVLDLDWPRAHTATGPPAPASLSPAPVPVPAPATATTPAGTGTDEAGGVVVVRRGDTLWGLAHQALQAQGTASPSHRAVAQAWPAWWSANREVVGDDPDLLLPGTTLQPPAPGASGRSGTP